MKAATTKSISFLMEFVIVLCFFCIASIICISIYTNSYRLNQEANHGKKALVYAQNYIEGHDGEKIEEKQYYLDEKWNESKSEKAYQVKIIREEDTYKIAIFENEQELLSLPFTQLEGDVHE